MPSSEKILDLSPLVTEVRGKEAALVLTGEGRIVGADFRPGERQAEWIGEIGALVKGTAALLQDMAVGGLESAQLTGPQHKMFFRRSARLGFFIVFIGSHTMDMDQAARTARNISVDMEAAAEPKK